MTDYQRRQVQLGIINSIGGIRDRSTKLMLNEVTSVIKELERTAKHLRVTRLNEPDEKPTLVERFARGSES